MEKLPWEPSSSASTDAEKRTVLPALSRTLPTPSRLSSILLLHACPCQQLLLPVALRLAIHNPPRRAAPARCPKYGDNTPGKALRGLRPNPFAPRRGTVVFLHRASRRAHSPSMLPTPSLPAVPTLEDMELVQLVLAVMKTTGQGAAGNRHQLPLAISCLTGRHLLLRRDTSASHTHSHYQSQRRDSVRQTVRGLGHCRRLSIAGTIQSVVVVPRWRIPSLLYRAFYSFPRPPTKPGEKPARGVCRISCGALVIVLKPRDPTSTSRMPHTEARHSQQPTLRKPHRQPDLQRVHLANITTACNVLQNRSQGELSHSTNASHRCVCNGM